MAQGWNVNSTTDIITFFEPPPVGVNNIVVQQYSVPASGGATDVFALSAWGPKYGYPSDVEFYGDRLFFAGNTAQPQTVWASKIGNYPDFGKTVPSVDDDAITATLNARQVNAIKDLVPLDKLLLLTSGGEWKTSAGQEDVLTPTTIAFKPQSYNGGSDVPALVIGNTALYVQNRGYIVRDIGYQFESDGYTGNDLTVFASHLTEGKPIISWCYQQVPYSIVWSVRDDGVLLALTYMKEQSVVAWTPMEIDGFVESVCSVPEGDEDAVYIVVVRDNGRFIERLSSRVIFDLREGKFLDSCLTYDGRNTEAERVMTVIPAVPGDYSVGAAVSLACTGPTDPFAPSDVGNKVVLGYEAGANAVIRITSYNDPTLVFGVIETPGVENYAVFLTADWGLAKDQFSGLDHLNGETVGVLGDGLVQATQEVIGGEITLTDHAVIAHVGLQYASDFETLEINIPGAATTRLQNKVVKRVGVIVQDSRSIRVGPTFSKLKEAAVRDVTDDPNGMPSLLEGTAQVWVQASWASQGRVCIRQADPLPLAILGVVPEMTVGEL